jgi:transposase InsO family protein
LKKHKLNGSPYGELRHWRRFQTERQDSLWQIDIRGPFSIGGERKLALVIVDDNSRFLVSYTLHKNITSQDVIKCLKAIIIRGRKPTKVLVDFGLQFRKKFECWCRAMGIEIIHTPKSYPQAKGKSRTMYKDV